MLSIEPLMLVITECFGDPLKITIRQGPLHDQIMNLTGMNRVVAPPTADH
jgi:hypothetical protein